MSSPKRRGSGKTGAPKQRNVLLAQAWWEDRVLRGVAAYAGEHDWRLDCRMRWTHRLPKPDEWAGDGIIAFAGVSEALGRASGELVRFVRSARVPVVETQQIGDLFGAPKVIVPHDEIGRLAASHFLEHKFRDLGYVTFNENPMERARRAAFEDETEANGANFHPLAWKSLKKELPRLPRPTALLAFNDANALEVVRLCRTLGAAIPEEFAVMGVDDSEIVCDLAIVPLTSINCNFEKQGYEAAALLERMMDGEKPPRQPRVIHPAGVTVRRSTDTVAMPDLGTARLLRFIRDNYRRPITVEAAAAELAVPLRQAHDVFKDRLGRSPARELRRLRVAEALRLLRDPRLKLERIAAESGFSSRFHLAAALRRSTGKPPRRLRAETIGKKTPREPEA